MKPIVFFLLGVSVTLNAVTIMCIKDLRRQTHA